ncbi:hypothetical protein [Halobaculum lipolyticum]|uniref:Nucleotide-diphospho-sugar transferase domain-containing protein n=1 Tax=Halobaculum lipolyticum TaxID=3032001 RepID=A0ABD5WD84_9EURY|nr:hypothetical protein [Halobaculum sp. DT31]
MPTNGVLFVATGQRELEVGRSYIEEAEQAAAQLNARTDLRTVLFTDRADLSGSPFSDVIEIEDPDYGFRDKVKCMKRTPFDRTLFLDTDTWVTTDIADIFSLLDNCALAVAHDPVHGERELAGVPSAFPEFNTGVLLYRNDPPVREFFDSWLRTFDEDTEDRISLDQPAFRKALFESDLRYVTLTREWNCRYNQNGMIAGEPRILHGRLPHPRKAERALKPGSVYRRTWFRLQSLRSRRYLPYYGKVAYRKLKRDGIRETVSQALEQV